VIEFIVNCILLFSSCPSDRWMSAAAFRYGDINHGADFLSFFPPAVVSLASDIPRPSVSYSSIRNAICGVRFPLLRLPSTATASATSSASSTPATAALSITAATHRLIVTTVALALVSSEAGAEILSLRTLSGIPRTSCSLHTTIHASKGARVHLTRIHAVGNHMLQHLLHVGIHA